MEGRFYEPDDKICLIFGNEHYEKLRERPEFNNEKYFGDMPLARKWAKEFKKGIKAYGFS